MTETMKDEGSCRATPVIPTEGPLRSCPFCGGRAQFFRPGEEGGVDVGCSPKACGARLRFFTSAMTAARHWNRRARPTRAPNQAQDGYEADAIGEVNQYPSPPEKP